MHRRTRVRSYVTKLRSSNVDKEMPASSNVDPFAPQIRCELLRAFAVHGQLADDFICCNKLVWDKAVFTEWDFNANSHLSCRRTNSSWFDSDVEVGHTKSVHDPTCFVRCVAVGATRNDCFAAALVNGVVSRVFDHGNTTEFKCCKKTQK